MCVTRSHGEKSGTVSLVFGLCAHQGSYYQRIRSMPPTNTNTGSKYIKIQKQCLSHQCSSVEIWGKIQIFTSNHVLYQVKTEHLRFAKDGEIHPCGASPIILILLDVWKREVFDKKILKFRALSSGEPRSL